jgi:hypothetical protein
MDISKKELERHRQNWEKVAKDNNWYKEPFYIYAWVDESGKIVNSVATRQDMDADHIADEETEERITNYNLID